MESAAGRGACAGAANQRGAEQHLPWLLTGRCPSCSPRWWTLSSRISRATLYRWSCIQRRSADVRSNVVHRSRAQALHRAQLTRQPWIDPVAFAPKCRTDLESKGCQPCRTKRPDRCYFEIAPRRFRTWRATCRRRDPAIGNLPQPTSNSPTRQSVVRRSMRLQSLRPRRPTLTSQSPDGACSRAGASALGSAHCLGCIAPNHWPSYVGEAADNN